MSSQIKSDEKAISSADSSASTTKQPKRKFKHTRELLRIAIGDGMTQDEIAKLCRVSQSIVSKWASGESRGTEQSLAPLLKRYGSRLSRITARVYLVMDDPDPRWENSEMGLAFSAAQKAPVNPAPGGLILVLGEYTSHETPTRKLAYRIGLPGRRSATWDDLREEIQVRFASEYATKLVQVEGAVVFRHVFSRLDGRVHRAGVEPFRTPVARWLLHDGLRGKFILVRQYRRYLLPAEMAEWAAQLTRQEAALVSRKAGHEGSDLKMAPGLHADWVGCDEDAARWVCRVERPMSVEELLAFVDSYVQDSMQLHTIHDRKTLPFLLRKALIERRYGVPNVERIADYE